MNEKFNEGDHHVLIINAEGRFTDDGCLIRLKIHQLLEDEGYQENMDFHADRMQGIFLVLFFAQAEIQKVR